MDGHMDTRRTSSFIAVTNLINILAYSGMKCVLHKNLRLARSATARTVNHKHRFMYIATTMHQYALKISSN
jgi:hypothetical protein